MFLFLMIQFCNVLKMSKRKQILYIFSCFHDNVRAHFFSTTVINFMYSLSFGSLFTQGKQFRNQGTSKEILRKMNSLIW